MLDRSFPCNLRYIKTLMAGGARGTAWQPRARVSAREIANLERPPDHLAPGVARLESAAAAVSFHRVRALSQIVFRCSGPGFAAAGVGNRRAASSARLAHICRGWRSANRPRLPPTTGVALRVTKLLTFALFCTPYPRAGRIGALEREAAIRSLRGNS